MRGGSYIYRTLLVILTLFFANTWSGAQSSTPFLSNLGLVKSEAPVILVETATSILTFRNGELIVLNKKTGLVKVILDHVFAINNIIKEKGGVFIFSKKFYSFDTLIKVNALDLSIINIRNELLSIKVQIINKPDFFIIIGLSTSVGDFSYSSNPTQLFILKDNLQTQYFEGVFLRTHKNTVFTLETISRLDFQNCRDCSEKIFNLKFKVFTPNLEQKGNDLYLTPISLEQGAVGPRQNCGDLSKLKATFIPNYFGLLKNRYVFTVVDACGDYLAFVNPDHLNDIVLRSK